MLRRIAYIDIHILRQNVDTFSVEKKGNLRSLNGNLFAMLFKVEIDYT